MHAKVDTILKMITQLNDCLDTRVIYELNVKSQKIINIKGSVTMFVKMSRSSSECYTSDWSYHNSIYVFYAFDHQHQKEQGK